ncbi:MAG: metal ABC transporter permease [Planctomycetaceae bacterium]
MPAWSVLDTWIVIIATLAAMACALPGTFLLLRRRSMMGDALSHTVLPGIVIAFLFAYWLKASGWISAETYAGLGHAAMFGGAVVIGVVTAVLTEAVQKLGRVESTAALGVVYTSLFALGLLLVRFAADSVHIDPECVLYGEIETAAFPPRSGVPRAAIVNGLALVINLALVVLFFKELRLSAFDPALATTMGINASLMHYALMAVTAVTLVAAFESIGSILVIAMLIVPAATAGLLTERLWLVIVLGLAIAAASALLGHLLALTLPDLLFRALGFEIEESLSASTAGMMAAAAGLLFAAALLFSPRQGVSSQVIARMRLGLRIASEDLLGALYRREEVRRDAESAERSARPLTEVAGVHPLVRRWALFRLLRRGLIERDGDALRLTAAGRSQAARLVRAHRLWESYLAEHFELPPDHLHQSAHVIEHYLDPALETALADELGRPRRDPHGRDIPR